MIGFALEGGGARGAYQAGAYMALVNNGIKPKMIAGTSIGALNAAVMVQGNTKKLIDLWLGATTDMLGINSKIIAKIKSKNLLKEDLWLGLENLKQILSNKGIDTTELLNFISKNVDENKIRKSKIKFGLVTVRVKGMKPLELTIDDIPKGKLNEYILASCYLPIFSFKKIIDDNYYLDGGFYNNIPMNILERNGCNKIYAIRIKGLGFSRNKLKKETEVIEIKPRINLGSIVIFDHDSSLKIMKAGYYDALKVIKNLDGINYYFYKKTLRYYNHIVKNISYDVMFKLKKKFRTDNNKELVIKVVEYLLKQSEISNLNLYNVKKQIRYLRKHNLVNETLFRDFIDNCGILF